MGSFFGHDYIAGAPQRVTQICDDGKQSELPTRWQICATCQGEGQHSLRLGVFTENTWAELDREERQAICAGEYDTACEACSGSGKIKVVDQTKLNARQREILREAQQSERDDYELTLSELRFGC